MSNSLVKESIIGWSFGTHPVNIFEKYSYETNILMKLSGNVGDYNCQLFMPKEVVEEETWIASTYIHELENIRKQIKWKREGLLTINKITSYTDTFKIAE